MANPSKAPATAAAAATPAATVTVAAPAAPTLTVTLHKYMAGTGKFTLNPKRANTAVGGTNAAAHAAMLACLQANGGTATGAQLTAACAAAGNYKYANYCASPKRNVLVAA